MNAIRSMLSEGDGTISTMRVLTFVIILSVLVPSVVLAIRTNQPVQIDTNQIVLLLGALGVKAGQRAAEGKS